MKKKNCAIFEIVCYVVAALLAINAIYMTYENIAYISEYLSAYGMTFSDMKSDIIQTVLSTFVPHFTYAFVVFGIGKIYGAVKGPKCEAVIEEAEEPAAEAVEEIAVIAEPAEVVEEAAVEAVEAEVVGVCEEEEK